MNLDHFKARVILRGEQTPRDCYIDPFSRHAHVFDEDGYDEFIVISEGDTILHCTGLKDANGTLIYEGDKVRHNRTGEDGICITFSDIAGFFIQWSERSSVRVCNESCSRLTIIPPKGKEE